MTSETRKGWIEKRNYLRVAARYEISYAVVAAEAASQLKGDHGYDLTYNQGWKRPAMSPQVKAFTLDISSGGLCLVCSDSFPIGTYLLVQLALPGLAQPVRVLCMVMRQECEEPGQCTTGLQTVAINKDDLHHLESFLASQAQGS